LLRIGNCKAPTKAPLPCVNATEIDAQAQNGIIFGNTTNIMDEDTVRNTTKPNPLYPTYNGLGIWYKIKPSTIYDNLVATTCFNATNFDTVITVYRGDSCRPREFVDQDNDNNAALCSRVTFVVSPSTTYWIFVDGYYGTENKGDFQLTVRTF
jgi:hypothetical protein